MSSSQQTILEYLQSYENFVKSTTFKPDILKCLFTNAYNHLFAGSILAERGLITQMHNCLRMGLESEWLGLILMKDPLLAHQWAFGLGEEEDLKRLVDLERPKQIRKMLGDRRRITVQDRDEIYSALSDKSHTKLASVSRLFIEPGVPPHMGNVACIPMGGIKGENNIKRIRQCPIVVVTFALAEIEDTLDIQILNEEWKWDGARLTHISEGGFSDGSGKVQPHISSQGHPGTDPIQAIALLNAIRDGKI